jgi:hypothetical protein
VAEVGVPPLPQKNLKEEARLQCAGFFAFLAWRNDLLQCPDRNQLGRQKEKHMDNSRKANREGNEITLQYKSRQETLLDEELDDDKLEQLRVIISQLDQTPPGAAELQHRRKLFGECKQIEGETSGQFYARLRYWLDREIPQTKLPLHAPRQTGE